MLKRIEKGLVYSKVPHMLDTQFNGSTSEIGRDFMKFIGNHSMTNLFARMKKANAKASVRSSKIMTFPEFQAMMKDARGCSITSAWPCKEHECFQKVSNVCKQGQDSCSFDWCSKIESSTENE